MKKVVFSSDNLSKIMKQLGLAVSEKAAKVFPATKNVLISVDVNEATLITTDIESTIAATCPAETEGSPFQIVLPYKYLMEIISHSKGLAPVKIEHPSARVARIIIDQDVYEQKGLEKPEDFVKTPAIPKKKGIDLGVDFLEALAHAQSSAMNDELRPNLSRVCLDISSKGANVVSTDSHIMYIQGVNVEGADKMDPEQFLISPKLAKITAGLEKVNISQSDRSIVIKAPGLVVWMKTVEGKYVDYRMVIPELSPNLKVNRKDLITALGKAAINANEMMQAVIQLDQGEAIVIEMDNIDQACKNRISLPGKYTGQLPRIAVNAKKVITVLQQVETEEVDLHITGKTKAVLVTSEENASYLGLIMPLNLD